MSLGHVYIVLEPVGSARLTFGDDRYYELMCFDVPKIVRSPGFDHGHDEESRNGRDVKIDILDDYIWTSERFRVVRVFFGVPGSYGNTGEEVYGPYWALGGGRGRPRAPPLTSPNWTKGRGGAPSFLLFPLPLPCLLLLLLGRTPSWTRKGGILLPVGVGLP